MLSHCVANSNALHDELDEDEAQKVLKWYSTQVGQGVLRIFNEFQHVGFVEVYHLDVDMFCILVMVHEKFFGKIFSSDEGGMCPRDCQHLLYAENRPTVSGNISLGSHYFSFLSIFREG